MHISTRWLARHVDLTGIEPKQLAADLTLSTAEVEGLERFAPVLSDVVVGFVQARERHPDADHLSVCTVDVGGAELLRIVCGAPNVDAGQKVAVAQIGTRLSADLKIKKSKIRGVESHGMICSERELGLGEEHEGIWVLDSEAKVGRPVAEALDSDDWVVTIDNKSITHRPDLWGHRGVAAEVAAIYRRQLKPLDTSLPTAAAGKPFPVRIESQDCSRYIAIALDDVQGGKSPNWLRMLLLAVGQRPIDLLVDVSNFVMLDLGQPNHLFDRTRLSPEGIVIRKARAGERMTTLDGIDRALQPTDLLICSGDDPVGLAGVMGGAGSKVGEDTRSLLLEVASFHPATIRRTATRLSLRTDASARFEKNLSPRLALDAAGHLVRTLQSIQPKVHISAPLTDVGLWKDPARTITLRPARVRKVLGAPIDDAEIRTILQRLGLETAGTDVEWAVSIPSARATRDLTGEHDLVEEIGRIYRYEGIGEKAMVDPIGPPPRDDRRVLVRRIEDRLAGASNFHQTISYSFVADELLKKLALDTAPHVQVVNPVAEGLSRIRRSVLPSLFASLVDNRRHRGDVRMFEIGKGYLPERAAENGEPFEVHELALLWARPRSAANSAWNTDLLLLLQGALEDLFDHLRIERPAWEAASHPPSWANPGRAKRLGDLALLAHAEPAFVRALGLSGELASDVVAAELSMDALLDAPRRAPGYRPIPRFPGVKVDVALDLPDSVRAAQGVAAIEKAGKGLAAEVELFDVYSGPNLGAGRRSLAWHVLLQDDARTLSDEDGQKFLARLEREARELGGKLRRE